MEEISSDQDQGVNIVTFSFNVSFLTGYLHGDDQHFDWKKFYLECGTLLPRISPEAECRRLTIRILKIGLKDPSEYINPFITVSVKGLFSNELQLTSSNHDISSN